MTISQQIREVLAKAPEPLNIAQLLELCDEAQTTTDVAAACYSMTKAGTLERERPEGGPYQYRLASGAAPADPEAGDKPDATEARASRVTPSGKLSGPDRSAARRSRSPRHLTALTPVTGKAPPPRPGPPATSPVEADLQIAITEAGILALRRGEVVLYLSPDEQARIEAFSGRFRAIT